MNKTLLENFINKFNLAGEVEAVTIVSDGTLTSVSFATNDQSAIGFVSSNTLNLPAGKFDVFETAKLKSLLAVLDDDIEVDVVADSIDGTPTALIMKDSATKVKFALADNSVIPIVPALKSIPPFEVEIDLDQKLFTTFVKASGALRDSETFTIVPKKDETKIVIGHSEHSNQNSVAITVTTQVTDDLKPLSFNAAYLRSMIQANKDTTGGKLFMSSKGLSKVTFDVPNFTVEYYLVRVSND